MHAMVVDAERHALTPMSLPDPLPGDDEVAVRVRAAGLAYADLGIRAGTFGASRPADAPPLVAGTEFAGEVTEVGAGVDRWRPGDRVMGRGPGYAESVVARADHLLAVPSSYSWEEAGGAPVALLTAHDALVTNGGLRAGDVVVVQGATSSVGIAATRLAAALGARSVFIAGRSRDRLEAVRGLVHRATPVVAVDVLNDDLTASLRDHGSPSGADIVIDMIGGSALTANIAALAVGGRMVQVGRLGGRQAAIDLDDVARKRLTIVGVTFRTRSAADVTDLVRLCAADIEPIVDELRPPIHRTYPLAEAAAAQDELAGGGFVGKIVLVP